MNLSIQPHQLSQQLRSHVSESQINDALRTPIIILSAPRSGSTLLFEHLTSLPGTSWIGGESHRVYRNFPQLGIANSSFDSASLDASHASSECKRLFRDNMAYLLRNSKSQLFIENPTEFLRNKSFLIEKTPRNALNIQFLNRIFPDAKYIYLHRSPADNIASIMEAWNIGLKTGRFVTFPQLPGWDRRGWCFLLPPGWRHLIGKSLADIAMFQWQQSNQTIIDNLSTLPEGRYATVSYETVLADPQRELSRLLRFIGMSNPEVGHENFAAKLSSTTISAPQRDKWKRHADDIKPLLPKLKSLCETIEAFEHSSQ